MTTPPRWVPANLNNSWYCVSDAGHYLGTLPDLTTAWYVADALSTEPGAAAWRSYLHRAGALTGCPCGLLTQLIYALGGISERGDLDDIDVYPLPPGDQPTQYHPACPPTTRTCPHGTTWVAQPTADQRLAWAIT